MFKKLKPKEKEIFNLASRFLVEFLGEDVKVYAFGSRVIKGKKGEKHDFDIIVDISKVEKHEKLQGRHLSRLFEALNPELKDDEGRLIRKDVKIDIQFAGEQKIESNKIKLYPNG